MLFTGIDNNVSFQCIYIEYPTQISWQLCNDQTFSNYKMSALHNICPYQFPFFHYFCLLIIKKIPVINLDGEKLQPLMTQYFMIKWELVRSLCCLWETWRKILYSPGNLPLRSFSLLSCSYSIWDMPKVSLETHTADILICRFVWKFKCF